MKPDTHLPSLLCAKACDLVLTNEMQGKPGQEASVRGAPTSFHMIINNDMIS